ncbi:MAG: TAXI family TRAP transporter solute-binding subunit [Pseudomonadales bacterium]
MIKKSILSALLMALVGVAVAESPKLPRVMAWSAYNLGTTGYNQAVGIAKMLKDQHRVTLRVIPGKNDVSRLLPLMVNRVQFSANGVSTYFAQEGTFQFSGKRWGPQPLRVVMMSLGLSNQGIAVAADSEINSIQALAGKRVPYVLGAPALNVSTEAIMACGGLRWADVTRVEFPGYVAMWNAMIAGQIDTAYATTVSGPTRRLEASPRGIRWLTMDHQDSACWQRVQSVAPYMMPNMAVRGAGISEAQPHEGGTYPYPILTTLDRRDEAMVYAVASAIDQGFERFKNADPGSMGWQMSRQKFKWLVPYHPGAIQYFQSLGLWNEDMAQHQQHLLDRQKVLARAWTDLLATRAGLMDDEETWSEAWLIQRANYLDAAGFDPIWRAQ